MREFYKEREPDDNYFLNLAISYLISDELSRDYKKAFNNFKDLTQRDDPIAKYYLGYMYKVGEGVKQSDEESERYFIPVFSELSRLAEEGDSEAQYYLSLMYYNGYGCKKDLAKSLDICKKSAENGYKKAILFIIVLFQYENIIDKYITREDFIALFEKLEVMFESFDYIDKFLIANFIRIYIIKDEKINAELERLFKESFDECLKKAENGASLAQFQIGLMYNCGFACEENIDKAIEWFTKSAEHGCDYAQQILGRIYRSKNNVDKAIEYLTKSSENGNIWASFYLAETYMNFNEYINIDKAISLLFKVLDNNISVISEVRCLISWSYYFDNDLRGLKAEALFYLVVIYIVAKKDLNRAIELCKKYAETGYDYMANYLLGEIYEQGGLFLENEEDNYPFDEIYGQSLKVEQDINKAIEYYKLSAEHGDKEAKQALKRLGK